MIERTIIVGEKLGAFAKRKMAQARVEYGRKSEVRSGGLKRLSWQNLIRDFTRIT